MLNSTSSNALFVFNYNTFKYEIKKQKNNNNSISGYTHINDGAMWIPDLYYHILSFLEQSDKHNIWLSNNLYKKFTNIKPDPNKYKPTLG